MPATNTDLLPFDDQPGLFRLPPEDQEFAEELARNAIGDAMHDIEDADAGEDFKPFPHVSGEFLVPVSRLCEWQHHPRRGSREWSDHNSALMLTAESPEALRPIVILLAVDGQHPIVDGRFRWAAIRAAHPNEDVEVRCTLFQGDEAAAVASVCDDALGTLGASLIEQAQALLSLQRTNNISQTAIARRYPGLTISKVSDMIIAAKMKEAHPALFDILLEPDRAPISYGVKVSKLVKALSADEFAAITARARHFLVSGEQFKPGEVFDVLHVDDSRSDEEVPKEDVTALGETDDIEDVFGHDDQPVGMKERLADGVERLCLPPVAAVKSMTAIEREAAANAFVALIRKHFGLHYEG